GATLVASAASKEGPSSDFINKKRGLDETSRAGTLRDVCRVFRGAASHGCSRRECVSLPGGPRGGGIGRRHSQNRRGSRCRQPRHSRRARSTTNRSERRGVCSGRGKLGASADSCRTEVRHV